MKTQGDVLKHIHAIVDKEVSLTMSTESPYSNVANALLREDRAATHRIITRLENKLTVLNDIVSGCERCSIEADLKEDEA